MKREVSETIRDLLQIAEESEAPTAEGEKNMHVSRRLEDKIKAHTSGMFQKWGRWKVIEESWKIEIRRSRGL